MTDTRILVVEDEVIVAESIRNMLRQLGYVVPAMVSTGEEAIECASETELDLVLMDIGLAGEMDGVEAAQVIRSRFDIPVIYLTAYADNEILQRAKITEPLGYMLKPFEARELQRVIEMALYKHEMDQRLRESEARYRAISELTSDFAYSLRVEPDGKLTPEWETDALIRVAGGTLQELVAGGGWERLIHPDDLTIIQQRMEKLLTGQSDVSQYRILTTSGEVRWVRDYGQPVWDEAQGRVVRLYGAAQDITQQVQAEAALLRKADDQTALYEASHIFLDQFDEATLLQNACRLVVELFALDKAWIGLAVEDSREIYPATAFGFPEGYLEAIRADWGASPPGKEAIAQAVRTARPVAMRHADSDPAAREYGYRSAAALPLCYGDEVLGAVNLYSAEEDHFTEDRLQVFQSFANLAAVALQRAHLYEEVQHSAAELEQRVARRTTELRSLNEQLQQEIAERERAEQALRESKERFRTVADFTSDWEYWIDPNGQHIYVSPSCEHITGYPIREFQEQPGFLESIVHPDDHAQLAAHLQHELTAHRALAIEFRIITRAGDERWIDHVCRPVYSADGRWLGQRASNRDITDRKQVEETLRQYERIVAATPDLMALLDVDYVYRAVNDAYLKAYGISRKQVIGHTAAELMGDEVFENLVRGRLERCLEGIATQYQGWLAFPRRGRRYMSVTFHPHFNAQNTLSGVVMSLRDITELKRAEEALRRSEAKHRAIFATSPDHIYLTDVDGRFLDANPAFLDWAGLALEEIQQRYFTHFFAGKRIDQLQAYFETLRNGHEVKNLEVRVKNTRGEVYASEINAVPLKEDGEVKAILNIARDITERVRAEEALRESEEKHRALFEASTDAIFLETVQGQVLDCNATACDMYGYTREELIGLQVTDLVPEEVVRRFPEIISELLAAGGVFTEAAGKRKDGSVFPTEVSIRLIEVRGKQMSVVYVRDTTAQAEVERELRETRQQLEAALRKLG